MSSTLLLVLIVTVAYLATHLAFDWMSRRLLIVSGAEYLVLGLLLGPQISGIFEAGAVASFAPVTTFALAWVGTIVGMQFRLPELVRIPGVTYRLAFVESLTTLGVVTLVTGGAIVAWLGVDQHRAAVPALALGAIAAASAPSGIELVARRLRWRGSVVRQLQVATAIDAAIAVTTIGLLACVQRPPILGAVRQLTATEWAVLSLALGVVSGGLFHLFLGSERKIDRLVVALGGAVLLTAGAAAYTGLSPLLASAVFGFVLANTTGAREEILGTLTRGERPVYFVLLILAGASWTPSAQTWWPLVVVAFLVARVAGKLGGAFLGATLNDMRPVIGGRWGIALLGHGGLALALALDYARQPGAPLPSAVFTAAIASVLLTDFLSIRLVQSVLFPLFERERSDRDARPGTVAEDAA